MDPYDIIKKVKRIEITSKDLVENIMGGEYHSAFKGKGMTFSEVREYQPGDDIRFIDWNVTARTNSPFVKVFEEERELTVYLMVDISGSGYFGSENNLKNDIGIEIASVLGFSAIKNNDKVGLVLFSDEIERYLIPKKGKSHVLRLIRELLCTKPQSSGTSIQNAISYILKVAKRKSVIFIISDFIDIDYWQSLKVLNKKHDLIGIKIFDPAELYFPDVGLIKAKDPETNESFWFDSSSKKHKDEHHKYLIENQFNFYKISNKMGFDVISIDSQKDYIQPLMSFFKNRGNRY